MLMLACNCQFENNSNIFSLSVTKLIRLQRSYIFIKMKYVRNTLCILSFLVHYQQFDETKMKEIETQALFVLYCMKYILNFGFTKLI